MASQTSPNIIPPSPSPHINPLNRSRNVSHGSIPLPLPSQQPSVSPIPLPPSHLPAPYLSTGSTYSLVNSAVHNVPSTPPTVVTPPSRVSPPTSPASTIASRKQAQHSSIAKSVMSAPAMSRSSSAGGALQTNGHLCPPAVAKDKLTTGGVGIAASDTPVTTAPNSPRIHCHGGTSCER
ncbi:hypothetical protein BDZ91DRAFT_111771 [Kalaharituber pfeilii]|nr:hypothetical protein BDZ91DRAFT_111771 [Kalaharituber pfeilii]